MTGERGVRSVKNIGRNTKKNPQGIGGLGARNVAFALMLVCQRKKKNSESKNEN